MFWSICSWNDGSIGFTTWPLTTNHVEGSTSKVTFTLPVPGTTGGAAVAETMIGGSMSTSCEAVIAVL